jgi:hypothetical protein
VRILGGHDRAGRDGNIVCTAVIVPSSNTGKVTRKNRPRTPLAGSRLNRLPALATARIGRLRPRSQPECQCFRSAFSCVTIPSPPAGEPDPSGP